MARAITHIFGAPAYPEITPLNGLAVRGTLDIEANPYSDDLTTLEADSVRLSYKGRKFRVLGDLSLALNKGGDLPTFWLAEELRGVR